MSEYDFPEFDDSDAPDADMDEILSAHRDESDGDVPLNGLPSVHVAEGQTDLANARRLKAMFGERVRYCFPWKKWLIWDGRRLKPDEDGAVQRLAKAVADSTWREARQFDDSSALRHAARTASASGQAAMLNLFASEVPIHPDEMDQNPWLLNVLNGTIDLRTGEHREHRKEDNITKLCPVEYDISAVCPNWHRFQLDVAGGDAALVDFKRRLYGYCGTGSTREQILCIFHGSGGNGKTTETNVVQSVLGNDYAGAAPKDLLMVKKGSAHLEMVDLFGLRMVIAQETESNRSLAESLVKQLTGSDPIKARRNYENFWQFIPTHKLILFTNHPPRVRGTDHGIWRRLRLVPFNVRFDGSRKDPNMQDKLLKERQGILTWIVSGAVDWYASGLCEPDAVRLATESYRSDSDVIGQFIDDCCIKGDPEKVVVKFSQFHESLEKWCADCGNSIPPKRATTEYLDQQGYARKPNNGLWFKGIGLRATTNATE